MRLIDAQVLEEFIQDLYLPKDLKSWMLGLVDAQETIKSEQDYAIKQIDDAIKTLEQNETKEKCIDAHITEAEYRKIHERYLQSISKDAEFYTEEEARKITGLNF